MHIPSSEDRADFLFSSLHCTIILTVHLIMLCIVLHCSALFCALSLWLSSWNELLLPLRTYQWCSACWSWPFSFFVLYTPRMQIQTHLFCFHLISSLSLASPPLSLSLSLPLSLSLSLSLHPQTHQETCGSRVSTYDCVLRHGQDHQQSNQCRWLRSQRPGVCGVECRV